MTRVEEMNLGESWDKVSDMEEGSDIWIWSKWTIQVHRILKDILKTKIEKIKELMLAMLMQVCVSYR